ncbi:ATP-binding protein [Streptomyces filamentosus]
MTSLARSERNGLAANALLHTRTGGAPIRVTVTRIEDDQVEVAVTDLAPHPLGRRQDCPSDEDGRGLDLVAALSARRGCDHRHWGKRVWVQPAR